ncbi:MAG: hypothetical protein NTZ97_02130 [Candidatus Moranbacteria bacterium]|nr:hypothetical protein [Candidatus Moranbacteria bacterium]
MKKEELRFTKDVPNGTDLGLGNHWDNEPCRKIVDQRYQVLVEAEEALSGLNNDLQIMAAQLETRGFAVNARAELSAVREFISPLECWDFINQDEMSELSLQIAERKFSATGQSYYHDISKEYLAEILEGKREPACRLKIQYNPNFSPCCDIGD